MALSFVVIFACVLGSAVSERLCSPSIKPHCRDDGPAKRSLQHAKQVRGITYAFDSLTGVTVQGYDDISSTTYGPLGQSFTAPADGTLNSVTIQIDCTTACTSSFDVQLFSDSSSSPGSLIASLGTISDVAGPRIVSVPGGANLVTAGTRYWIVLSSAAAPGSTWAWTYSLNPTTQTELFSNQAGTHTASSGPYTMIVALTMASGTE